MEGSLPDQQLVAGPVTRPQTAPRSALRKVPGATRCDPTHFSLLLVGQREAPRCSNGHQPLHRVSGSGHSGRHTQLLKTHAVQPRGRQAQSSTALLRASGEQGARHRGRFGKEPERRKQRWGWPGELLLHIKEEQEAKGTAFWAVGAAAAPRQDRAAEAWPALGGQGPQGRALGFTGAQAVRVCLPTQEAQVRALLGELEIKSLHALWCSQSKQIL